VLDAMLSGLAFTDAGSRWLTVNTIKARCRVINQFVSSRMGIRAGDQQRSTAPR
jgi:hypothetical protein